jgi:FKBP-type peptidyl-prolyl cis-trans isomerase (trigger factor)
METHNHNYTVTKKTNLPHSILEIEGVIGKEEITAHRKHAIDHLKGQIEFPGFRKGHVPEDMIISRLGEYAIIEEAASHALAHLVPEILIAEKVPVLSKPSVTITKLAPDNDLEFKISVPVIPTFDLPDYKKIAHRNNTKKSEGLSVEETEIDKVVDELRKIHGVKKEGSEEVTPAELTDEFVKKLGNFKDVSDLRAKVKENMLKEKEVRAQEKKRIETAEEIILATTIDTPEVLVESELAKMENQFKDDISSWCRVH